MRLVRLDKLEQQQKLADMVSPATRNSPFMERKRQQLEREHRLAAAAAEKLAVTAEASKASTLLDQLKATLLALVGRVVDLREGQIKQASGTVITANKRWAAMHVGRDTQLLDRKVWPVEVGHGYELRDGQNGPQLKPRPVDGRTASTLEYVYGKQVGELAKEWAERDNGLTQSRDRGHSPGLG